MRDDYPGDGALFLLICLVIIAVLAGVSLCNGTEPVDEPTDSEEISVYTPAPQQREETEEERLRRTANKILNCTVTYYCAELYEHICGNGDGLTATGAPVVPYATCAVDPGMIPLGSHVWVDYGDGVLHEYIAQDVGGAVIGGHVDLAVATHTEADECGRRTATVYWKEQ